MATESRAGLPSGLTARRVAAARGRARWARLQAIRSGAGLRVVPLFIDGVPRLHVHVTVGGMVDIAVRELGARIIEVEPLSEEPPVGPPGADLP